MSHITIIIGSRGGSGGGLTASGNGQDDVQVTYTPPDDMDPKQVGREVAKRLKWIESAHHMDAADD